MLIKKLIIDQNKPNEKIDPLKLSVVKGFKSIINKILTYCEYYKNSTTLEIYLNTAIENGFVDAADTLINYIKINKGKDYLNDKLLLSNAINTKNIELIRLLLNFPTYINKDDYNKNSLRAAMIIGNKDIIDCLLTEGASNNYRDTSGKVPFQYCPEKLKLWVSTKYGLS